MTIKDTPRSGRLSTPKWVSLALTAVLAGCGSNVSVSTVAAPESASLGVRRTFTITEHVDTTPVAESGNGNGNGNGHGNRHARDKQSSTAGYGIKDPMIENTITSRAVAGLIQKELEARGFRYVTENPDFEVRFDATVAPIEDSWTYDDGYGYGYGYGSYGYAGYYGHGFGWGGPCCGGGGFSHSVSSYERKTVIIDAVDPSTGALLWRGQGTADGYNERRKFMKDLRAAVHAIVKRFPTARTGMLASQ